jgi:hypothetical protein
MRKSDEEAAPWTGPLSCPQQEVILPLEQTRQLQSGTEAEFMNYNFVEVSGHKVRVLRLEVSVHNVFLHTSHFCSRRGGVRGDCE